MCTFVGTKDIFNTHTAHIEVEELLNGAHILIWPDVFQFIKDSLDLIIV